MTFNICICVLCVYAQEALRGSGGILVNKQGKRFVNELTRRMLVTQHIFDHGDNHVTLSSGRDQRSGLMILNQEVLHLSDNL